MVKSVTQIGPYRLVKNTAFTEDGKVGIWLHCNLHGEEYEWYGQHPYKAELCELLLALIDKKIKERFGLIGRQRVTKKIHDKISAKQAEEIIWEADSEVEKLQDEKYKCQQ